MPKTAIRNALLTRYIKQCQKHHLHCRSTAYNP